MLRRRDTHELHAYALASGGGYEHTQSLVVDAYPPGTQSASGTRQTTGGLAEDADMVAVTTDDAADAIDEGQSVVLERAGDGQQHAYVVEAVRPLPGRYRTIDEYELALAREEGADLSMFPQP